ncbi:MAG: sigma-70 family RNA polymerase sigma factor [Subdoligranulum sp.]|nr:sigma-70 family RNA polymerase sigma factor [Subdoligranulum sp.]
MYCTFCGKQIAEDAAFCQYCGKPVPQGNELAKLVAAARAGDQDAVSALYEKTYSKVFYTVKSMIKDEDAVFDIVQDTYLKAFAHLDTFEGDTKFLPWVRQIAANTARDHLKKKRPVLFAEMTSDDGQDTPVEELLPDAHSEDLPDQVIDQKETKRLLQEILEELPEDQRAAIGMFYYEEMSVKQIAAAMGASESAVKSRLMYARGKIEKKVLELEKKGTKLYNLAPLPFLLLLFRSLKTGAAEVPDAQILQAVLAAQPVGAAAAGTAGTVADTGALGTSGAETGGPAAGTGAFGAAGTGTAGTMADTGAADAASAGTTGTAAGAGGTAAAAGGLGALKIGVIALAAAAVIGIGIFGAAQIDPRSAGPSEPSSMEDHMDRENAEIPGASAAADAAPEELTPIDAAFEQYRIIIGQADRYEYGADLVPTGYRYALVQMRPDDPVPTLLLEVETEDFISYARFFQYDPDTKTVRQPAETVMEGVAGAGGYRGGLTMAGDGEGIFATEWSSGTGEAKITRITLDGDAPHWEVYWTGRIDLVPDSITRIAIDWHEIADLSALDGWTAPESGEAALSDSDGSDVLPTDGDRIVLTGTVGAYGYDKIIELLGLQEAPDPYVQSEYYQTATYHVIVLDAPQNLYLHHSGGSDRYSSNEVLMICIDYAGNMDQYEGRHITFSIDPSTTYWPSEWAPPQGQPFTSDIHVLE